MFTKCHVGCLHQFLHHLNYSKVLLKICQYRHLWPLVFRFTWCAIFILFLFSLVNSLFLFVPPQVHCFTTKCFCKTLEARTLHFNMEEWLKIWLVQFAPPISLRNFYVIKESFCRIFPKPRQSWSKVPERSCSLFATALIVDMVTSHSIAEVTKLH